ncbi:hypothetical protein [Mesorhizobium marinum]|uniref:hypothetical protein n=1 Tax=Mesorhizobium marinum TaxID=3228790 RepID=UPI0034678CCD
MANVVRRSSDDVVANTSLPGWDPQQLFDDEGAGATAPELLSPYRVLATAVRNAERVFGFWTYLVARADTGAMRAACEQMAHHELAHVAALRRERRRAYHAQGGPRVRPEPGWTLAALERRLADLLSNGAATPASPEMQSCIDGARLRAEALEKEDPVDAPVPAGAADRPQPCAEVLLDCYLDMAERLPTQDARDRAQRFAGEMIGCLAAIRARQVQGN